MTKQESIKLWEDRIADIDRAIQEKKDELKDLRARRRKVARALETVTADMGDYPHVERG